MPRCYEREDVLLREADVSWARVNAHRLHQQWQTL
jgi:hypothetical protein